MSRNFGDYESIRYELWTQGKGVTYPTIDLGDLLDRYAAEGAAQLDVIQAAMQRCWPVDLPPQVPPT